MTDIKGYKVLTDEQKSHINALKNSEHGVLSHLASFMVKDCPPNYEVDKRWMAIARTNIEQGFMAAIRAITCPDTVEF